MPTLVFTVCLIGSAGTVKPAHDLRCAKRQKLQEAPAQGLKGLGKGWDIYRKCALYTCAEYMFVKGDAWLWERLAHGRSLNTKRSDRW